MGGILDDREDVKQEFLFWLTFDQCDSIEGEEGGVVNMITITIDVIIVNCTMCTHMTTC